MIVTVYVAASLAAFVTFWLDKQRAVTGGRRVPEHLLHLLALVGGWPGAWLAARCFRHKTRKLRFRVVFCAIVLCHVVVGGLYLRSI